jgi:hypothetical protein
MIQRPLFLAAFAILLAAVPATSQEFEKTSDLPLFQALAGKRTESGILIVAAANQPFQGSATSVGQPFLGGPWFEIEGAAVSP